MNKDKIVHIETIGYIDLSSISYISETKKTGICVLFSIHCKLHHEPIDIVCGYVDNMKDTFEDWRNSYPDGEKYKKELIKLWREYNGENTLTIRPRQA